MKNIYFHTCEDMHEIGSKSARLVIVSPPFTNNPEGKTLDKTNYLCFIRKLFGESYRILADGGVCVTINTDVRDHSKYNAGESCFEGTVWHKHHSIREIADEIGYRCFDHKIWAKSLKENRFRYSFSHILFYAKPGRMKRSYGLKRAPGFGPDVWLLEDSMVRTDSNGKKFPDAMHPTIAKRCIDEFTTEGDLVVDPCVGSGTIVAVAHMMGRRFAGYEVDRKLERMIRESIYGPRPPIYETVLSQV